VGVYFLGLQIAQILDLILYGPYNLIEPVVIFSAEKQDDAPKFYARLLTYMLGIGIFFGLGLSCLAQDAIQIISNPAYWPAYQVVPLLIIFTIFKGVRALGGVGLSLKRKTGFFPVAIGSGLILEITLMLILVPKIGMIGAAIAMAATYVLVFLARMVLGHRYYPVPIEWGRIMKLFSIAAIIFGISQTIQMDNIWVSIILRGMLALSFPICLWLARFFRPEESVRLNLIFHQALRFIKGTLLKESSIKA
jgi:O-antigen/teichoic acid export membrane protein